MRSFTFALFVVFLAFSASAQETGVESVFPIVCNPGVNCYILSYPDLDRATGSARDYTCGPSANDGDGMLRIGVSNIAALREGVDVMAARSGKVVDTVDGIEDKVAASRRDFARGTSNCGNGIIIDHGGGVQTGYCHLRRGSIVVKPGQHVNAGDVIAQVGQSGVAFWPQLGFSIQSSGMFTDPVSGMTPLEGCGWKPRPVIGMPPQFLDYQPAALVAIGFAPAPITEQALVLGAAPSLLRLGRDQPSMTLYGMVLGLHKGDIVRARIRDPRGRTVKFDEQTLGDDAPRLRINLTHQVGSLGWAQGTYTGEISVTRQVDFKPTTVAKQITTVVW